MTEAQIGLLMRLPVVMWSKRFHLEMPIEENIKGRMSREQGHMPS